MTAYAQGAGPDRTVIAQAKGILVARHGVTVPDAFVVLRDDAHVLGVPVGLLAEYLVRRAGVPEGPGPGPVGADLDTEIALQAEIRRRRPEPLDLDLVTEARLRTLLH